MDLDPLINSSFFKQLPLIEKKKLLTILIKSLLVSVPQAASGHNHFSTTMPSYILGVIKDNSIPYQLCNAFVDDVDCKGGVIESSIKQLKSFWASQKDTWCINTLLEVELPELNINEFINRIINYVIKQ